MADGTMGDMMETVCDELAELPDVAAVAVVVVFEDGTVGRTWSPIASLQLIGATAFLQQEITDGFVGVGDG
jgi:hypothetical protein